MPIDEMMASFLFRRSIAGVSTGLKVLQTNTSATFVTSAHCLKFNNRWTQENSQLPPIHDFPCDNAHKRLPTMPRQPTSAPKNKARRKFLTRGFCRPEDGELEEKKYAVICLDGGFLQPKHFTRITNVVNKMMASRDLSAKWRVPAPWRPVTRHPLEATMGGGKGKISYYDTPIKARQVIFEVWGNAEFDELYTALKTAALALPMEARAVHYEMLKDMYAEEERIEAENENFFTFREVLIKNMNRSRHYLSPYDFKTLGKLY